MGKLIYNILNQLLIHLYSFHLMTDCSSILQAEIFHITHYQFSQIQMHTVESVYRIFLFCFCIPHFYMEQPLQSHEFAMFQQRLQHMVLRYISTF